MNEASKIRTRLQREGTFDRYISGTVLDIGCGADKIIPDAVGWDKESGDAQKLEGVPNDHYDTVFSSHCLEHMRDPLEALLNWYRVLKPGGYLVVNLPDEDLYEQGIIPSIFNPDHKWTFTISKDRSWSPRSRNVVDLLFHLGNREVVHIRRVDTDYDYSRLGGTDDQTLGTAEAGIEFIVKKHPTLLVLRSGLTQLIQCPMCAGVSLVLRGTDAEERLDVQCQSCGWTGRWAARG
jgi:SAM-dependent methyltransferase